MRIGEVRHAEHAPWGKPLEGVRILAVEPMQALPYAARRMAHLGAELVKIEDPVRAAPLEPVIRPAAERPMLVVGKPVEPSRGCARKE